MNLVVRILYLRSRREPWDDIGSPEHHDVGYRESARVHSAGRGHLSDWHSTGMGVAMPTGLARLPQKHDLLRE